MRDRARTQILEAMLDWLTEIEEADGKDYSSLTVVAFAARAGVSPAALYKTHRAIARAINLINHGLRKKEPLIDTLETRIASLSEENNALRRERDGALDANFGLVIKAARLRRQLLERGLSLVSESKSDD